MSSKKNTKGPNDAFVVNASPTKNFFVNMLVKDIDLIPAIADLVDNCVDGARRERASNDYTGLYIRIRCSKEEFLIEDNCGGIDKSLAKDYAFRFGRPDDMPSTPHSIGQFGVGMKRSLFKIGNQIEVKSNHHDGSFTLPINVTTWIADPVWDFRFSESGERDPNIELGTRISIRELAQIASSDFDDITFAANLIGALSNNHQDAIQRGLIVTVNGNPLASGPLSLLASPELRPGRETIRIFEETSNPLAIVMLAGVSHSAPKEAGWYIYCNGRLIVGPDQTGLTGWGSESPKIPRFHNASQLPWNTTKTGLDKGTIAFRRAQVSFLSLMRPVIDFLNELDAEIDNKPENIVPLETYIASAKSASITTISLDAPFKGPERVAPKRTGSSTVSISFRKEVARVEKVKAALKVESTAEVGSRCFEYFWDLECN
jgi:Histidine kinase-, DNA gyrase B-, and HSP90-like ATPase